MKRIKKHRVKREMPESSHMRNEEHDLAHYIHDRVELMHQVFSVMKHKELKAMAPECVRHISLSDLQELCTEELLGISSKRLCAILDGADPPSNTESSSSSPDRLETISLDSISSDEEILSQGSSKKSRKHKHHRHSRSKNKQKHREDSEQNSAARAGLTVLELLELQARARAIRAQLHQHQTTALAEQAEAQDIHSSGDDEVVIKEEAPEVVELSSDDEKPSLHELEKKIERAAGNSDAPEDHTKTVTKRINDLIITVPQSKTTRKIKLNRNKCAKKDDQVPKTVVTSEVPKESVTVAKVNVKDMLKDKKSKKKQKKKCKQKDKDGSDHDEITLQLSDSEKMDLLEDFDRKRVSSEDSESSSSSSNSDEEEINKEVYNKINNKLDENCSVKDVEQNSKSKIEPKVVSNKSQDTIIEISSKDSAKDLPGDKRCSKDNTAISVTSRSLEDKCENDSTNLDSKSKTVTDAIDESVEDNKNDENKGNTMDIDESTKDTMDVLTSKMDSNEDAAGSNEVFEGTSRKATLNDTVLDETSINSAKENEAQSIDDNSTSVPTKSPEKSSSELKEPKVIEDGEIICKNLSEGELSEESIEIKESKMEVVFISDDETKSKKKKKKEKKSKKSKKSDFRESADHNFFKITETEININKFSDNTDTILNNDTVIDNKPTDSNVVNVDDTDAQVVDTVLDTGNKRIKKEIIDNNSDQATDDVFEYLELSDDSSCYEVEGVSVLSKEPTTEEIVALSVKIDEIDRVDVVTEKEIREHESLDREKGDLVEIENISWRDRYLESKKVKSVLNTSNILNALRKKNKELKKKIEQSKNDKVIETPEDVQVQVEQPVTEGSIDQYNTLQGSTKFVDPIKDVETAPDERVTKEMEKDAKQLLKMYKKLLKYNDINKKKDRNKNKKKKHKKSKDKSSDKSKS